MPTMLDYLRGDAEVVIKKCRDIDKRMYLNKTEQK